jgi:hypothetical protein
MKKPQQSAAVTGWFRRSDRAGCEGFHCIPIGKPELRPAKALNDGKVYVCFANRGR